MSARAYQVSLRSMGYEPPVCADTALEAKLQKARDQEPGVASRYPSAWNLSRPRTVVMDRRGISDGHLCRGQYSGDLCATPDGVYERCMPAHPG